ncbi:MAG: TonB-dependent receptor domain-containing protein, partial [Myxococcota bacterium]
RNAAIGVSARRSYIDGVRWIQRQNGGAAEDVLLIPTYWDWQLKLDWDVTAGHELVLFAFGSGDREFYVRDGSGAATPYEEIRDSDFARLGLRYSHILGDGLSHSLTPMIGFERRLKDVQAGLERQSRDTFEAQLRDELTWRDEQSRVVIGVDATTQVDLVSFGGLSALPPVWQLPIVDTEGAVRDLHHNATLPRATLGMYGEGTFTPLEGLSFTPGLRLDAYWVNDEPTLSVEPRVAGSYQVLDGAYGFTVRAGGGVFASPPSPEDTAAAARFGRRLESSRALHLQGGFEQLLGNAGAFSTTLFAVERDHVPLRVPSFPSSPEPFASPIAATGSAQSRGVEVLLRLQASAETFGWASYTLARHQLRDGRGLGAESAAYASEVDTTHLVSFVGQTSLGAGFRFGGRYRIATGQPYTPILGGVFDADGGRYLPVYAPRNAARHETFQAVDLRVDWSALLPWLELVLYADLVNAHFLLDGLLGNNATEDFIYSSDYSASSEVKGLPLIPTLGVKATF